MDDQQERISELEERVRELSVALARFTHPARGQRAVVSGATSTPERGAERDAAATRRPFAVISGGRSSGRQTHS